MEANKKQIQFHKLVDELMKTKPNQSRVKELTSQLGLPFKVDPIEQIDFVLKSAHGFILEEPTPSLKKRTGIEG